MYMYTGIPLGKKINILHWHWMRGSFCLTWGIPGRLSLLPVCWSPVSALPACTAPLPTLALATGWSIAGREKSLAMIMVKSCEVTFNDVDVCYVLISLHHLFPHPLSSDQSWWNIKVFQSTSLTPLMLGTAISLYFLHYLPLLPFNSPASN